VIAILAAGPTRVVPVERIIDAVRDDDPPNAARDHIQICISGLRRVLDGVCPSPMATRGPGYHFDLVNAGGRVDLGRFEDLIEQASRLAHQSEVQAAVDQLERALSLWSAGHLDVKIAGSAYPSGRVQRGNDNSLERSDVGSGEVRQLGEQRGVVLGAAPVRLDSGSNASSTSTPEARQALARVGSCRATHARL
jgi:hypothetical protein